MLMLNDGRSELWQWDTGRKLTVDADCSQVHFSNKVFGRSIDVDVVDGVAVIPDILLQTDKDLNVWAFVGTPENGYTKISKVFKVNKRNKPADYVFTPPEQTTLEEIKEKLDYLESIQAPDAIKNAVDEYLANNPIQIDEKDPTVPDWAKQTTKPKYTATEVGAVAKVNGVKPDANGNVEITIPDSGGNVDVKKPVEFDSIEENKVYNGSFPTGVTLNGYNTYNKAVTPGEVYYITSMPVENNGYGIAHFFNGDTFISLVGEYPSTSGMQTDFEVTVPEGATIMRVIPGKTYGSEPVPPTMWQWSSGNPTGIALDTTLTQSGKAADAKAVGDEIAELSSRIEELGAEETRKIYDEFDVIEENKIYTKAFPDGYTINGYTTYTKNVQAGETYYITSRPVENTGYGIAHFFNGNTFVSVVGEYPNTQGIQTGFEVIVPDGATLMRIIPGKESGATATTPAFKPIVWHWTNGKPAEEIPDKPIFATFDGTNCIVKVKYNDTEDVCVEINSGGGNNLPDIHCIFTVSNADALNDDLSVSRILMSSQTDIFSPHVVGAVANVDGDTPENVYFTGGNHQTNNAGTGGAVTARSEGITVKCDGKTVGGNAWGDVVTVSWVNYIQGYNTSNATGTGREIMKEEITLTVTGTKIAVDVRHYALEDIVRKTYYGLQMICGAYAGARYIGGSNRANNVCNATSNSGNKKCRAIGLESETGDLLEIGIFDIDLGSFEHSAEEYSAFIESYGKSYFSVIQNADFEQRSGEMTTLRGYYHIMHK